MTHAADQRRTSPSYPTAPAAVARTAHLPTIRAAVRYWRAVREQARAEGDEARARTADALASDFMALIPRRESVDAIAGG